MLSNILGGNTMKEKSLTVSDKNGASFTITSTEDRIQAFLKWIAEYKRGNYIATENVVLCKNPADMKACNLKAIRMNYVLVSLQKRLQKLNVKYIKYFVYKSWRLINLRLFIYII